MSEAVARPADRFAPGTAAGAVIRAAVDEGHLRVTGPSRAARILARAGVVTLVAFLGSLLVAGLWRQGHLITVPPPFGGLRVPQVLPEALIPVTLLALALGWTLLAWGTALSSLGIRLAVAAGFILSNGDLGNVESLLVVRQAQFRPGPLQWGPIVVRIAYLLVPVLLLLPSLVPRRARGAVGAAARVGLLLSIVVVFVGVLGMYVVERNGSEVTNVPIVLDNEISNTLLLALPMQVVGGLAAALFAWVVARALASGAASAERIPVKALLAGAIGVKIVLEGLTLEPRSAAIPMTVVGAAILVGTLLRTREPGPGPGRFEERLLYGGATLLALPWLVFLVAGLLGNVIDQQTPWQATWLEDAVSSEWVSRYGYLAVGAALVLGTVIGAVVRRGRGSHVLWSMALAGVWVVLVSLPNAFEDLPLALDARAIDLAATGAVGVFVAFRWRSLDRRESSYLLAFVIFTALVLNQIRILATLAIALGLAPVVILVGGVTWTLLGDSGFTAVDGRRTSAASRSLMWVGYLLLSVALVNWQIVTNVLDPSDPGFGQTGFVYLAVPLIASLLLAEPVLRSLRRRAAAAH